MKPEEKAKELVEMFFNAQCQVLNKTTSVIVEVEEEIATQCALICVDEIIKAVGKASFGLSNYQQSETKLEIVRQLNFYGKVKSIIQEL